MLFTQILLDTHRHPAPEPGVGRIHTIDDHDEELPPKHTRRGEIVLAVQRGAFTVDGIAKSIPFQVPRSVLFRDCEDLAREGALSIKREKGKATRVSLACEQEEALRAA